MSKVTKIMEKPSTRLSSKAFRTKEMCTIVGNSMIPSFKENSLLKNGSIKVRSFPESTVDDIFVNFMPILNNGSTT